MPRGRHGRPHRACKVGRTCLKANPCLLADWTGGDVSARADVKKPTRSGLLGVNEKPAVRRGACRCRSRQRKPQQQRGRERRTGRHSFFNLLDWDADESGQDQKQYSQQNQANRVPCLELYRGNGGCDKSNGRCHDKRGGDVVKYLGNALALFFAETNRRILS